MKMHDHDAEGPPCRHMEDMLQRTADGSANPLARWYALSHAARCGRCGRFLARLKETLGRLRSAKAQEPNAEVENRLKAGPWQQ